MIKLPKIGQIKTKISSIKTKMTKPKFPERIQIETTTLCPNGCIMCPHPNVKRPKHMPIDLVEKILSECRGEDITIIPHLMGDPMADDRIFDILEKCKSYNLTILMSTSGFYLNKEKSQKLIDIGVDTVNISFDSLNKETYEKIRKLPFEKIMKNTEELLSLKRNKTKIWVSAVDMFFNETSRKEYFDYWKKSADHVQITPFVKYPNIDDNTLPDANTNKSGYCYRVDSELIVSSDGEYSKCCIDYQGTTSFGNANKNTVREIWNGKPRKDFIKKLKKDKRKTLFPCSNCSL